MAKPFADAFYHSSAWKSARASYLNSVGGLCEDCLKVGIYTPATIVHHIKELSPENINDPSISLNFDNFKAVCFECHRAEHCGSKHSRYVFLPDGQIIEKD